MSWAFMQSYDFSYPFILNCKSKLNKTGLVYLPFFFTLCLAISANAQKLSNIDYSRGISTLNSKLAPIPKEAFTLSSMSQRWDKGINFFADGTQALLHNWAAGGKSSLSFRVALEAFSKYRKGYIFWNTNLALGYGAIKQTDALFSQKTDDRIELTSALSRTLNPYISATTMFNFRSQFVNGYSSTTASRRKISAFMAPGYVILSLGATFHPSQLFNLFFAPVSGRFTFVRDSLLSKQGAYGVAKGKIVRNELGSYLKLAFEKDNFTLAVLKNVSVKSTLSMFINYLSNNNPNNDNPRKYNGFALNFENTFTFKVNQYINCNISLYMIYDQAVRFPEKLPNGKVINEPKLQLKEILGIGFVYDFANLIKKSERNKKHS